MRATPRKMQMIEQMASAFTQPTRVPTLQAHPFPARQFSVLSDIVESEAA